MFKDRLSPVLPFARGGGKPLKDNPIVRPYDVPTHAVKASQRETNISLLYVYNPSTRKREKNKIFPAPFFPVSLTGFKYPWLETVSNIPDSRRLQISRDCDSCKYSGLETV